MKVYFRFEPYKERGQFSPISYVIGLTPRFDDDIQHYCLKCLHHSTKQDLVYSYISKRSFDKTEFVCKKENKHYGFNIFVNNHICQDYFNKDGLKKL